MKFRHVRLRAALVALAGCSSAQQDQNRVSREPADTPAVSQAPVPRDTMITFGSITRDLTGDTIPEVITLTGTGPSIEDLAIAFTIQSSGRQLYARSWRLARANYDGGGRPTDAEYRARVGEYGRWFFDDRKFMSPERFLTELRSSARLHVARIPQVVSHEMGGDSSRARMIWDEMQAAGITIFEFSPGGDRIISIGWSATDQRFYNLLECC